MVGRFCMPRQVPPTLKYRAGFQVPTGRSSRLAAALSTGTPHTGGGNIMDKTSRLVGDLWWRLNKAVRNGPLVLAVSIPLALGSVVGAATFPSITTWYQRLDKPKWCPPAPIFGQTWSLWYGLMGYASYLVWQKTGLPSRPLIVYGVQLGLNLLWQALFFIGRKPKAALVENGALLALVGYTTYEFWRVSPSAGKLMLPYLAFNAFAVALNKAFVDRNPGIVEEERQTNREKYGGTY